MEKYISKFEEKTYSDYTDIKKIVDKWDDITVKMLDKLKKEYSEYKKEILTFSNETDLATKDFLKVIEKKATT
jgi:uncharacterized coiled-coil DUF342 family protein